jgi:hypothetical protein
MQSPSGTQHCGIQQTNLKQIIIIIIIYITIFWDVFEVSIFQRTYSLHLEDRFFYPEDEGTGSSKMLEPIHQTMQNIMSKNSYSVLLGPQVLQK